MPMRFPQLSFSPQGSRMDTCEVVCSKVDPRDLNAVAYALKRGYRYWTARMCSGEVTVLGAHSHVVCGGRVLQH